MVRRAVILGAAGRDFHDFNTFFRGNEDYRVVAFLQVEGQNLAELDERPERTYPASLAGEGYGEGIPILPAENLEELVREEDLDDVFLSYSDISHEEVMHQASRAIAAGASFHLLGPGDMMLESEVPVVAVDAVRTGAGKSQASRKIAGILEEEGVKAGVVREPMPYGDLEERSVERFDTLEGLDEAGVTIEEREEYEQHIEDGRPVYAGVDYRKVLSKVEEEAEAIVWEGGNNELPFFRPDLHFVLAAPHRPGHGTRYHPGEANLRMADYVVVNKENTAEPSDVEKVVETVEEVNPDAGVIHADSVVTVENPGDVEGARVLVVEDGPTLTHGGTDFGAGKVAAGKYGAAEVVDARDAAVGSIREAMERYGLEDVVPAMGYSPGQVKELERTIENSDCDLVLSGTPHDLERVLDLDKPVVRARYAIEERGIGFRQVLEEEFLPLVR